jgi:hypothetical protein
VYTVVENKNQTVDVYKDGKLAHTFSPTMDLDKSVELITKFNQLKTKDGRDIAELWNHKGFYYYAAYQEWLFWDFFVGIVQHKEALEFLHDKAFQIKNPKYYLTQRVKRINKLLNRRLSFFARFTFNIASKFLRSRFIAEHPILLNDVAEENFRFKRFKHTLSKFTQFHRAEHPLPRTLKRLFNNASILPYGGLCLRYETADYHFCYDSADFLHDYVSEKQFQKLIESIDRRCQDAITETKMLEPLLASSNIKIFIGYDQIELVAPLVAACRLNHINTYGHQHGPISPYHLGWIAYGIDKKYCNLHVDTQISWGQYWIDLLLKTSNKFDENSLKVGAHLNKTISHEDFSAEPRRANSPISILVPYEFLADNLAISDYINEFLNLGWKVTLKLRPDGDDDVNIDMLSFKENIRDRVSITHDISENQLKEFDAVVCTQTVFAIEMMRFNTPIWYLETGTTFLRCVREDGIAHTVTLDICKTFSDEKELIPYLQARYNLKDYKSVFSNIPQESFIKELLAENNIEF